MTIPIFESQDISIECHGKRSCNGAWINFIWEPGLSLNGENCISTNTITFEDGNISELANKDKLVESIRLSSAGGG